MVWRVDLRVYDGKINGFIMRGFIVKCLNDFAASTRYPILALFYSPILNTTYTTRLKHVEITPS